MEENNQNKEPLNKDFKVPKLRFKEFVKEWENIKLKDISARIKRKNKDNLPLVPLTISAQKGLINQYDYFDKQIASLNLSNYYIIQNGEFAYNKSYSNGYPYGAIKRLDYFEQGALSSLYICFSISNINSDYLVKYFDSGKWNKQVKLISGEGARNHGLLNLSPDDFFNINIMISEQTKIAHFLNLINSKIKYMDGKIEALKKYKEGLILKALKPSIENWKTSSVNGIRLSSFLVPYKKLASTDNYIHATLSKEGISDKTERYNRDFLVKDENKKYRITDEGDLIYNPANLKFGVICINHYGKCVVSPIYETFKVRNIDRDLLESIVTSKSFIRYALKFEEGTVYERRAVSVADLLNIKICVDDNNLDNISNILKIIQRKINKLNYAKEQLCKIKSYLLNAMFI